MEAKNEYYFQYIKEAIDYLYANFKPTGAEAFNTEFSDDKKINEYFQLLFNIVLKNTNSIDKEIFTKHVNAFIEVLKDNEYVEMFCNIVKRMYCSAHYSGEGYKYSDLLSIDDMDEFILKVKERFRDRNIEKHYSNLTMEDFLRNN